MIIKYEYELGKMNPELLILQSPCPIMSTEDEEIMIGSRYCVKTCQFNQGNFYKGFSFNNEVKNLQKLGETDCTHPMIKNELMKREGKTDE
jgi:hypothetical protein